MIHSGWALDSLRCFVSSHLNPENLEGTRVIVGSMNMGFVSGTTRTCYLFHLKNAAIPLGHSEGFAFLLIGFSMLEVP